MMGRQLQLQLLVWHVGEDIQALLFELQVLQVLAVLPHPQP
jgi:hypothetical protein